MNTNDSPDSPVEGEVSDYTTPEGLRQILLDLTENDTWATSPVAAELMVYATTKYTPVARAWHRDPADAAYEAFIAMRKPTTLRAKDPWAVITRAVALSIAAETHADRDLTSQDKARRPSKRPVNEPVRAGHYEEFFYDVHPHAFVVGAGSNDEGVDRIVRAASVFLVLTGWTARPVEQAVDYIAYRVTGLASRQSAIEIVSADLNIAVRLGYRPDTWGQLVALVVGSAARGRGSSRYGLLARVLLGDDVADLLRDEDLVTRSRTIAATCGPAQG